MNITTLNTDTLFKFSTTLGLILVITPLFLIYSTTEKKSDNQREAFVISGNNLVEKAFLIDEIIELEIKFPPESFEKRLIYSVYPRSGKEGSERKDEGFKLYRYTYFDENPELIIAMDSINAKQKRIHHCEIVQQSFIQTGSKSYKYETYWTIMASVLIMLGVILIIWGLISWSKHEKKQSM